jgi:hypothetical protein
MNRIARFWTKFLNNWDNIRDAIARVGSILAAFVLFILGLFGINSIPVELALTLTIIGLLASSIHQDHQTNQNTGQIAQEISNEVRDLVAQQADAQRMLQALTTTTSNLDTHQLAMQQSLIALSGSVQSLTENKFFEEDDEAYKYLLEYINQHTVKEATFLQYSCQKSGSLLSTLVLNKKARATVFIQHEDMAAQLRSQRQVDRITSMIRNSLSDLSRKLPCPSDLKVYKYRTPATVRAVKIDDQALCVGWYTYEKVDRKNYIHFPDDQVAISGHDRPTIVVWKGTEEFAILDKMVTDMIANYQENAEEVEL